MMMRRTDNHQNPMMTDGDNGDPLAKTTSLAVLATMVVRL
jgi:hypothetical protein